MKNLTSFMLVILLLFIPCKNLIAQPSANDSWNKIISFHFGYSIESNDWEYSHPLYIGYGVQTISETGSFKAKSILNCEFEFSKGYFGISAGVGIIPAEINVVKPGKHYNFNSIFVEIEGIFFPLCNAIDKIIPLLKIGVGGIKSSGDLKNTALFISFGGGVRKFFTENFGASVVVKGRYITYDEVPLSENVTGDINITPFVVVAGIYYLF